jgi:hypothetical protein
MTEQIYLDWNATARCGGGAPPPWRVRVAGDPSWCMPRAAPPGG